MWSAPVTVISPYASHSFISMTPLCERWRRYSKVYITMHILMIIFFKKELLACSLTEFLLQNHCKVIASNDLE